MAERITRKIIQINEEKCDGCGVCVPSCHEGALQIIDGKARLVSEIYCDGLGDCLGECPQDAITIIEREAAPFDEEAVEKRMAELKEEKKEVENGIESKDAGMVQGCSSGKDGAVSPCCPPRELVSLEGREKKSSDSASQGGSPESCFCDDGAIDSELSNWPVQLHLVPAEAPFLRNPELLIAADCVPFACANFHRQILKDKALLIGCPKLDDTDAYLQKVTEILKKNDIRTLTVAIMEVPCCGALYRLVEEAVKRSGKNIELKKIVIGVEGSAV